METRNLDHYRLIAEGGQSKIYDCGNNTILRVPKREMDFDRIHYEYQVYQFLEGKLSVPKVYEIVDIENRPCLIMEKLEGIDLYSKIRTNPFLILTLPQTLSRLHSSIFSLKTSDRFVTNHQKAEYCIGRAGELTDELKQKLLDLLKELPDGPVLCHGDFHPGNIIESPSNDSIIDWSSASVGSPLFDIAHTYLLLMNTPRLDHVSDAEFFLQRKITGYIGKKYLKKVCRQNKVSMASLFPYLLIKAGERCFYGMPSEKKWLTAFIENTIDRSQIEVLNLKKYA